jgi:hypothetical protein
MLPGSRLRPYEIVSALGAGGPAFVRMSLQSELRRGLAESADGQSFLMNTLVPDAGPTPVRLILNWKPKP